ncbi:hypothetical protein Cs7R123_32180 [Catellatospora sp. TT07R-123]|nr:hypothetical protein Cs7R123_32180 [Catellatospora sp. TT07R-123]
MRVREVADCFEAGRLLLHLELRESPVGAWEVELVDREQQRRIAHPFHDETSARRSAEAAYAYGRQFGRWRVRRAGDYAPQGPSVTAPGWDPEPIAAPA